MRSDREQNTERGQNDPHSKRLAGFARFCWWRLQDGELVGFADVTAAGRRYPLLCVGVRPPSTARAPRALSRSARTLGGAHEARRAQRRLCIGKGQRNYRRAARETRAAAGPFRINAAHGPAPRAPGTSRVSRAACVAPPALSGRSPLRAERESGARRAERGKQPSPETQKHTRRAKPRAASSEGAPRSDSPHAVPVASRSARVHAPARGARAPRRPAGGAKERHARGATDVTGEEQEKKKDHRGAREQPCSTAAARTTHGDARAPRASCACPPSPPAPSLYAERRP